MYKRAAVIVVLAGLAMLVNSTASASGARGPAERQAGAAGNSVIWREPEDISSRDLFYGAGGRDHQPQAPFVFLKEDLEGSSPKFSVRDKDGAEWTVKLGLEAGPETAASRLVWAVGYFVNEDYFLPELHVGNMPARMHRGQDMVAPDGTVYKARLKRKDPSLKKNGSWSWDDNPFRGSRELNGLKIMMALLDNWDLKAVNNAVYVAKGAGDGQAGEAIYLVSDLGASFSGTGRSFPPDRSKGNLERYRSAAFIVSRTDDSVDFNVPTRPSLFYAAGLPDYMKRLEMRGIIKRIPRDDARWTGRLLAQLSPNQILDAFRAAGYQRPEAEGFTQVVLERIAELNAL